MKGLTKKEKDVLKYIFTHHKKFGFQPSLREIADHFKITAPTVRYKLINAEHKGYIRRTRQARHIIPIKNFDE